MLKWFHWKMFCYINLLSNTILPFKQMAQCQDDVRLVEHSLASRISSVAYFINALYVWQMLYKQNEKRTKENYTQDSLFYTKNLFQHNLLPYYTFTLSLWNINYMTKIFYEGNFCTLVNGYLNTSRIHCVHPVLSVSKKKPKKKQEVCWVWD